MKEIQFQDISLRYPDAIKSIQDAVIRKVYSNFEFQYLLFNSGIQNDKNESDKGNKNLIKNSLYYHLHDFKFITYYLFNATSANTDVVSWIADLLIPYLGIKTKSG